MEAYLYCTGVTLEMYYSAEVAGNPVGEGADCICAVEETGISTRFMGGKDASELGINDFFLLFL